MQKHEEFDYTQNPVPLVSVTFETPHFVNIYIGDGALTFEVEAIPFLIEGLTKALEFERSALNG